MGPAPDSEPQLVSGEGGTRRWDRGLDRRRLLQGVAVAAGGALLAGCGGGGSGSSEGRRGSDGGTGDKGDGAPAKGSATEPLKPPKSLHEAAQLQEQVKAGKLPKLAERLPEHPYVVPHTWLRPGTYGGQLHLLTQETEGSSNLEYMYGHSPLRWLNDGLDLGPGLVESWDSNDDQSEWTFHFRKGLKWSDGHPWSTDDIMFWWQDLVRNQQATPVPPDSCRSGKGTLVTMRNPDETTLVMSFDAPTPLTADRLATYVNGPHGNGPFWMMPKHYVKQFHPKYNPDVPKDWAAAGGVMETNGSILKNPDCPTMNGWKVKTYDEGKSVVWERNPYYWCVDPHGAQLPFIDGLTMSVAQKPEVAKLRINQGDVDFCNGKFGYLNLSDVSGLKQAAEGSDMRVLLWNSGSGTGGFAMFNLDYEDPKLRKLFREPKFRQALSHAIRRSEVRKSVYFNTGEPTTGTLSPNAIEYHVNKRGKDAYKQWRDSFVSYDPDRAGKLLDELGVVDSDGDGKRELPDGSKLTLRLGYSAEIVDEYEKTTNLLARDWKRIGLRIEQNPVSPEAVQDDWKAGRMMCRTDWGVSDGPNCLVFPEWLVPIESTRWAPLQGAYYEVRGTSKEESEKDLDPFDRHPPRMKPEPGGPVARLWELYDRSKIEADEMKRHRLVWKLTKIHVDEGPFFIGTVADVPRVMVAKTDLRNVPRGKQLAQGGYVDAWIHPTPAVYDPEAFFWENPERHS